MENKKFQGNITLNLKIQGAIFDYFAPVEDTYPSNILNMAKVVFKDAYILGIKSMSNDMDKLSESYDKIIKAQEQEIQILLGYLKRLIGALEIKFKNEKTLFEKLGEIFGERFKHYTESTKEGEGK